MSEVDEFLDSVTVKKDGKEIVITEEKVLKILTKLINSMNRETEFRDDFGMNNKLVSQLIEVKKAFWPATQKSLQGNIDFGQSLDKWFLLQKQLLEKSEENNKEIIYEITPNLKNDH